MLVALSKEFVPEVQGVVVARYSELGKSIGYIDWGFQFILQELFSA